MSHDPFSFRAFRGGKPPNQPASRKRQVVSSPRQVEDYWNFYKKGLTIARPGRGWPAWLIPLLALLLIVAMVFWGVPTAIDRIRQALHAGDTTNESQVSLLYGDDTWTVGEAVADVFDRDDLKAARLTQALFNEPVRLIDRDCAYGFVAVELSDGLRGYMFVRDLVDNRASIEPDLFTYKVVITAASKRIMSHASKGTLLVEVPMGTVLFADYHNNGIARVKLPDGSIGWLSDDGIMVLPALAKVEVPVEGARYFCNTAMAFNQVTVLPNGQTIRGVSTIGIARVAAAVNGVTLPRALTAMAAAGEPVAVPVAESDGLPDLLNVKPGDLVFLADLHDPAQPGDLAICVGAGMYLYASASQSSIQMIDLTEKPDLLRRVLLVRRIFAN
jgi:hypothetical protein